MSFLYIFMNLIDLFFLFFVVDSYINKLFFKKIYLYNNDYYSIIKKSKIKKIKSFEESKNVINLILIWIGASITFIQVFIDPDFFKMFFSPSFFIILSIFIIAIIIRYLFIFKSKEFKKLKKAFDDDFRLEQIRILIDELNDRKKALDEFDKYDKYRSEEIIKEELSDISKSIELLKKMYSYLELNNSTSKVNEGYNLLKETSMEKDELKNFEKEIDILNAKRDLDKNIDSTIEKLKNKYN